MFRSVLMRPENVYWFFGDLLNQAREFTMWNLWLELGGITPHERWNSCARLHGQPYWTRDRSISRRWNPLWLGNFGAYSASYSLYYLFSSSKIVNGKYFCAFLIPFSHTEIQRCPFCHIPPYHNCLIGLMEKELLPPRPFQYRRNIMRSPAK